MNSGIIFDIQKFALHDGPGIRTVVFLKGCSLQCAWCSNPESQRPQPQLAYLENKCIGCGNCLDTCTVSALSRKESKILVDHQKCITCKACTSVCPTGALKVFGYTVNAEEVIDEVAKDMAYFENSEGGMTLSGGEPLVQGPFALTLLKQARERGIHTAIETAGNVPQTTFDQVLPYVNLFLFDYKVTNSNLHQQYTGSPNHLLLSNIDHLYHLGASITLRCPIIPGMNDTEEHFRGIVDMSHKYPKFNGVELMPYHEYGADKYNQIGRKPFLLPGGSASTDQSKTWKNRLLELGCSNLM